MNVHDTEYSQSQIPSFFLSFVPPASTKQLSTRISLGVKAAGAES